MTGMFQCCPPRSMVMESPLGLLNSRSGMRRVLTAEASGVFGTGRKCRQAENCGPVAAAALRPGIAMISKASLFSTMRSPAWPLKSTTRSNRSPGAITKLSSATGDGQQTLIGADLKELLLVRQRQVEEAAIGGIQNAEAIAARFDVEIREQLAVDQHGFTEGFGYPGHIGHAGDRIVQLPSRRKERS